MSKFQIVSDVDRSYFDKFNVIAPNLIILGNVGEVDNNYIEIIEHFCKLFKNVILIPGDLEYRSIKKETKQEIENRLLTLHISNLKVLINTTTIIDDVLIFGSPYWRYYPYQYWNSDVDIYVNNSNAIKLITLNQFNYLHFESKRLLNDYLNYAKSNGLKLLVATHYPPIIYDSTNKYTCFFNNKKILYDDSIYMWIHAKQPCDKFDKTIFVGKGEINKLITIDVAH